MKTKEKRGVGLKLFSSFSRGKAGILGTEGLMDPPVKEGAVPVLLGMKKRGEEEEDGYSLTGLSRESMDDVDSKLASATRPPKSRRLPTRSYSLSFQCQLTGSPLPAKWTALDPPAELTHPPAELTHPTAVRIESLAKLSKEIQTSPAAKPRGGNKKRSKARRCSPLQLPPSLQPAENEIDRFEREFVKPMLEKLHSVDDLRAPAAGDRELHNTSLPPMHLLLTDLGSRLPPVGQPMTEQELSEQLRQLPPHTPETERGPSSTNSLVSDSNYDSGAFSRTSTPEAVAASLPTLPPPLVSPPLVLALLRSGQARIVDGHLVLACLNAAATSSSFHLDNLGCTGGVEITTPYQSVTDGRTACPDPLDPWRTRTQRSSAVTISIGSSTKLHVNEDPVGPSTPVRTRAPHMGTCRLGTPPLERGASGTPPLRHGTSPLRSMERSKISTVFLASGSPHTRSRYSGSVGSALSCSQLYSEQLDTSDVCCRLDLTSRNGRAGSACRDGRAELKSRDGRVVSACRDGRAESTSSQDSSGVSSSKSWECGSLVTVNGEHHCLGSEQYNQLCRHSVLVYV